MQNRRIAVWRLPFNFSQRQHPEAIDSLACDQDNPIVLQVIRSATGMEIGSVWHEQECVILTGMDHCAFQNHQFAFSAFVFQPPITVIVLLSVWREPFQFSVAGQDHLAFIVFHIVVLLSWVTKNGAMQIAPTEISCNSDCPDSAESLKCS